MLPNSAEGSLTSPSAASSSKANRGPSSSAMPNNIAKGSATSHSATSSSKVAPRTFPSGAPAAAASA
eukprot:2157178-Alexandrium_andersonii.AAC.1